MTFLFLFCAYFWRPILEYPKTGSMPFSYWVRWYFMLDGMISFYMCLFLCVFPLESQIRVTNSFSDILGYVPRCQKRESFAIQVSSQILPWRCCRGTHSRYNSALVLSSSMFIKKIYVLFLCIFLMFICNIFRSKMLFCLMKFTARLKHQYF